MTDVSFNKNLSDLLNAREHIQSNARSCSDIARWLKDNAWFVVAAQIEAKANDWNPYRQQVFLQAYSDFTFKTCKMSHEDHKIKTLKYHWETSFDYSYTNKKVPDEMEIDIEYALRLLGLLRLGVGVENGSGKTTSGHTTLGVPAQGWYFVANPCITETLATPYWNTEKSGSQRWFPYADLGGLAMIQESLGSSYEDIRAIAESRLLDTKNRSGFQCGPTEFSL